jgi:hypothetical protein
MSKTSKIVLWVIVLIVVVGAIAWFVMGQKGAAPTAQLYPTPAAGNATASPASPTGATETASGGLFTAPTDDSNAALNQDLATINSQLNGLASDSASIDQGLADQPVSQGE